MQIVLLSGGSGKRLWPLSNDIRSKQFIKIFPQISGEKLSMVQRVHSQIKSADKDASVTVATSKTQVSILRNQLGDDVDISVEPCRRDTFPAILLVSAYLHDVKGIPLDEPVAICPVDPYVDTKYFYAVKELTELARNGEKNLMLMGIEPTYPSEKYGYIIPKSAERISDVLEFKEKPNAQQAAEYIQQGALWNSGVFAYRLGYVLEKAHKMFDFKGYEDLFSRYEELEKISFDYAVVEQEKSIGVLRYAGEWKDLGTWNTLTEVMSSNSIGDVTIDEDCRNVHVINELDIPVLCMGIDNAVVAASSEGILVADKNRSSNIKPYVEKFEQPIRFAEKSWGDFKILDVGEESLSIKLTMNAGQEMNYHSHEHRQEVWTVTEGRGYVILDGERKVLSMGDSVVIPMGMKHKIVADTRMIIMEIQLGKNISRDDKIKWDE